MEQRQDYPDILIEIKYIKENIIDIKNMQKEEREKRENYYNEFIACRSEKKGKDSNLGRNAIIISCATGIIAILTAVVAWIK